MSELVLKQGIREWLRQWDLKCYTLLKAVCIKSIDSDLWFDSLRSQWITVVTLEEYLVHLL